MRSLSDWYQAAVPLLRQLGGWLRRDHRWALAALYAAWIYYASFATHRVIAEPATSWMRIYSYRDFGSWTSILEYLRDLRTGIPPALSAVELISFKLSGSIAWIIKGLYRKSMILMLLLPALLVPFRWRTALPVLGAAAILLEGILLVYANGNAQIYDVMLPAFVLMFFALHRGSLGTARPWLGGALALLAGFFLAMAELARPFMLAMLPLLLLYAGREYALRRQWKRLIWLLLPVLLISGGWHLKLLLRQDGQILWSNHGGSNLFRAWMPLVDQERVRPLLEPEAPPLNDFGWAWPNLNTEVHTRNSALLGRAVREGVAAHPREAIAMLWDKALIFMHPQTKLYDHDPQGPWISAYRLLVRGLFGVLAIMLLRALLRAIRRPASILELETMAAGLTLFLTLMPVIGEAGEEARFLVSVLPMLLLTAAMGAEAAAQGVQQRRK